MYLCFGPILRLIPTATLAVKCGMQAGLEGKPAAGERAAAMAAEAPHSDLVEELPSKFPVVRCQCADAGSLAVDDYQ